MTLHRRPLGRGRWMAALGGVLMVVGSVLPWWQVGGTPGITAESGNGLAGSGILVFLVGIATLALVALPYAAGDRPLGLDRWLILRDPRRGGLDRLRLARRRAGAGRSIPVQQPDRGPDQRAWPVARGDRARSALARGLCHDPRVRVPLGQCPDHPAIDRHDRAGDVGRGGRQQERAHAPQFERVSVASERDALDRALLDVLDRRYRWTPPGPHRSGRSGPSASRPGASPLIRTGTISVDQRLDQTGQPGPDEVRGGEARDRLAGGARQDDEDRRVAAVAQVREGGTQQADRAPQRAVDGGLPGGLVELVEPAGRRSTGVDDEEIEPAECGDRGVDRLARAVRRREVRRDGERCRVAGRPPGASRQAGRSARSGRLRRGAPARSRRPVRRSRRRSAPGHPSGRDPSCASGGAWKLGVAARSLGDGGASLSGGDGLETDDRDRPADGARLERAGPGGIARRASSRSASRPVSSAIPMTVKWLGHCDCGRDDIERLLGAVRPSSGRSPIVGDLVPKRRVDPDEAEVVAVGDRDRRRPDAGSSPAGAAGLGVRAATEPVGRGDADGSGRAGRRTRLRCRCSRCGSRSRTRRGSRPATAPSAARVRRCRTARGRSRRRHRTVSDSPREVSRRPPSALPWPGRVAPASSSPTA